MLDDLPDGKPRSSMGRGDLLRKLTDMAAQVVGHGHVELGLGWLLCNKNGDPVPRVPPDLFDVLIFVRDHGWQEVDAGYKGGDYFEDCLLLALRKSQTVAERPAPGGADLGAWARSQTAAQGT
jgi:hypothetical protein